MISLQVEQNISILSLGYLLFCLISISILIDRTFALKYCKIIYTKSEKQQPIVLRTYTRLIAKRLPARRCICPTVAFFGHHDFPKSLF